MVNLKDKKIMIYKAVIMEDDIGQQISKYKPIHPGKLWAYTRQLSQEEAYTAAQMTTKEERLFVVNWRNDIDTTLKVRYNGDWFQIVRVDTFEDYKTDLKVFVKTHPKGGVPKDSDLIPYE